MAMGSRGPFSNNLVDGDCSPSLGCKVFCRTPHCIGEWPRANGLMTSPRRCHGYPTVPATNTRGSCWRGHSFLWPGDQTTTLMSWRKKRREHLYCSGRNIIPGCWRMGRGDRSTCIYWAPEETSSPRPSSIPKHWKGEEERSWQLSPVVCDKSAPKTISPRPQGHQIGDLPRLQTGIWKSRLGTDDLLPEWLQGSEGAFKNKTGKNVVMSELQVARSPETTRERDE